MTIAVTGASGQLGRLVIERLKAQAPADETVVALARDPAKAADLGVPVRVADYTKPDTLAAALAGVDTLLLISSSAIGQREAHHRNVIEAAEAAGVGRIVYTSLLHADRSPISLAPEHTASEAAIRESGIPFTILRNGWYTENYAASIPGALAAGALVGSAGTGRIAAAARADFADAAVAAILGEGHAGKTYELAGDAPFTLAELAAEISRQSGRDIPYRDLPVAEYAALLASFGLPEDLARAIAGWDADASRGALDHDGGELSGLIGRPTTPLSQVVTAALK